MPFACAYALSFWTGRWTFSRKTESGGLRTKHGLHFHYKEISSCYSAGGIVFSSDSLIFPQQDLPEKVPSVLKGELRPAVESTGRPSPHHII